MNEADIPPLSPYPDAMSAKVPMDGFQVCIPEDVRLVALGLFLASPHSNSWRAFGGLARWHTLANVTSIACLRHLLGSH